MGKKKGKGQGPAPRSSSNSLSESGNTAPVSAPTVAAPPSPKPDAVPQAPTPQTPSDSPPKGPINVPPSAPVPVVGTKTPTPPQGTPPVPLGAPSVPKPILTPKMDPTGPPPSASPKTAPVMPPSPVPASIMGVSTPQKESPTSAFVASVFQQPPSPIKAPAPLESPTLIKSVNPSGFTPLPPSPLLPKFEQASVIQPATALNFANIPAVPTKAPFDLPLIQSTPPHVPKVSAPITTPLAATPPKMDAFSPSTTFNQILSQNEPNKKRDVKTENSPQKMDQKEPDMVKLADIGVVPKTEEGKNLIENQAKKGETADSTNKQQKETKAAQFKKLPADTEQKSMESPKVGHKALKEAQPVPSPKVERKVAKEESKVETKKSEPKGTSSFLSLFDDDVMDGLKALESDLLESIPSKPEKKPKEKEQAKQLIDIDKTLQSVIDKTAAIKQEVIIGASNIASAVADVTKNSVQDIIRPKDSNSPEKNAGASIKSQGTPMIQADIPKAPPKQKSGPVDVPKLEMEKPLHPVKPVKEIKLADAEAVSKKPEEKVEKGPPSPKSKDNKPGQKPDVPKKPPGLVASKGGKDSGRKDSESEKTQEKKDTPLSSDKKDKIEKTDENKANKSDEDKSIKTSKGKEEIKDVAADPKRVSDDLIKTKESRPAESAKEVKSPAIKEEKPVDKKEKNQKDGPKDDAKKSGKEKDMKDKIATGKETIPDQASPVPTVKGGKAENQKQTANVTQDVKKDQTKGKAPDVSEMQSEKEQPVKSDKAKSGKPTKPEPKPAPQGEAQAQSKEEQVTLGDSKASLPKADSKAQGKGPKDKKQEPKEKKQDTKDLKATSGAPVLDKQISKPSETANIKPVDKPTVDKPEKDAKKGEATETKKAESTDKSDAKKNEKTEVKKVEKQEAKKPEKVDAKKSDKADKQDAGKKSDKLGKPDAKKSEKTEQKKQEKQGAKKDGAKENKAEPKPAEKPDNATTPETAKTGEAPKKLESVQQIPKEGPQAQTGGAAQTDPSAEGKDVVEGTESTVAKKKRRRKKKNKKPAEQQATTACAGGAVENKPKKSTPSLPSAGKPAPPKATQPGPGDASSNQKTKAQPQQAATPQQDKLATADSQPNNAEGAASKKKKNKKKKKQGAENETNVQAGGETDSSGQKKTPIESQQLVTKVNPLAHHLSNCCCICKATSGINDSPLLTCSACSLACYCGRDHQKQHWSDHKEFCNYICSLVKSPERPYFFTPAETMSSDERRQYKLLELQACQKALNRSLTPLESTLILHPRACYTCYKPVFQNVCRGCYNINYCCDEHYPKEHEEWCSTLYIKLHFVQSQAKHGSAGVIVPKPSKLYYPLNSNMKEYLTNLEFTPPKDMPNELYVAHISELATYPLTLLNVLQLLSTQGLKNPLDYEHLVVHIVGAEDVYECCQILKWKYFFVNLLPNLKNLHLVFIGCELSIEDDKVHVDGRLVYEFHAKMTYLEYCKKCYIKPSIVCAFNSGLYRNTGFKGTDSWGPSLFPMLTMNRSAPLVLTAYTNMEINLDLQRLRELFTNNLKVVQQPIKNPFASVFPNHNLVSEHECPVAFRNYYLTIVKHM